MYYLISNNTILQTADTPFEVHGDIVWVEAESAPKGYTAIFKDGKILFQEIAQALPFEVCHVMNNIMAEKDVFFCIGNIPPNKSFTAPSSPSFYTQYYLQVEGSGFGVNEDIGEDLIIQEPGLYDCSKFKGHSIVITSYDKGGVWVAVNVRTAKCDRVEGVSLFGPAKHEITENINGVTVLNAKGQVTVDGKLLDLNQNLYYESGILLTVTAADDSVALIIIHP